MFPSAGTRNLLLIKVGKTLSLDIAQYPRKLRSFKKDFL